MQDLPFLCWLVPLLLSLGALLYGTYSNWLWPRKKILGKITAAVTLTSMIFVAWMPSVLGIILLLIIQAWIVLLCMRLSFGRLGDDFLKNSTRLNVVLAGTTLFLAILTANIGPVAVIIIALLSFGVAVGFLMQILWTLKHFKVKNQQPTQKPTLSICIPARNEDDVLIDCIDAVLQSDYPKLEILVLDDCSQDKTAQIIKSYARDGVRFIKGDLPADGWLGRTQAMQTLAQHANGEWLLFLSVDTKVSPRSVSKIVAQAVDTNVKMISVLPQNNYGPNASTLFGSLQYFWQIVLPIGKKRVPVSSRSWLIEAKALKKLGGFESVKHKILPEMSFARRLFTNDQYRFLISNEDLDMFAAKRWRGQTRTSLRLLYPTFRRQPFFALFAIAAINLLILSPFVLAPVWYFFGHFNLFYVNLVTAAVLLIGYGLVLFRTHPNSWFLSMFCLPYALAQELVLILISMLSYEFGEVNWKERNICYPVISQGQLTRPDSAESLH